MTHALQRPTGASLAAGASQLLRDGGMLTWRNLLHLKRTPGALFTAAAQPLMFVLLFAYVFGGTLGGVGGGEAYREFLMGGIFAQTVIFNTTFTTISLANDLQRGVIDRFRSLPMARVAVILGRTTADLAIAALTLTITSLCGLIIGWEIRGSLLDAVAAYGLILLFAFAMSWIGATIGLSTPNVEVAQSAGLIWLFPVSLISTAFVSASAMPGPLRVFAEWNPVSAIANASRDLFNNKVPASLPQPDGWPAAHPALYATLCALVVIAVFMPLAAWRYRKAAS